MKKYYDCSINDISNSYHIHYNFNIENDIMADLSVYSRLYGYERVYDYKSSDIIVTNTNYPDEILEWSYKNNIPRIKRMDGIYWRKDVIYKNEYLNRSAESANHIIFISNYSKMSLRCLYPNLNIDYQHTSVILNNVDEKIFYNNKNKSIDYFMWCSSATDWNREEKRLELVIEFSKIIDKNEKIILIGNCDKSLPINIIKIGYISKKEEISYILNQCDAFFSPFYRCAGSKVTIQAIKCGLPILYSNTGGLTEIVNNYYGIPLSDYENSISFMDKSPMDISDLQDKYQAFKYYFKYFKDLKSYESYQNTIKKYFDIFNLYF